MLTHEANDPIEESALYIAGQILLPIGRLMLSLRGFVKRSWRSRAMSIPSPHTMGKATGLRSRWWLSIETQSIAPIKRSSDTSYLDDALKPVVTGVGFLTYLSP